MASLASFVRVSASQSACWRECAACTHLAPLAPNETRCRTCTAKPQRVATRQLPRAA